MTNDARSFNYRKMTVIIYALRLFSYTHNYKISRLFAKHIKWLYFHSEFMVAGIRHHGATTFEKPGVTYIPKCMT